MTVYTNGTGDYFQPGLVLDSDPAKQIVGHRNADGYEDLVMPVTEVTSLISSGWTVAPGLTDIGGGVWVDGLLVDSPASGS